MVNLNAIAPYVLAMVVCDEAWRDPSSGKLTLLGIFNTVVAEKFPLRYPQILVYFALTDGRGRFPITVRFVAVGDKDEVVEEATNVVTFEDPRAIHEGEARFADLRFGRAGEYRFELLVGSEPLVERRIEVRVSE